MDGFKKGKGSLDTTFVGLHSYIRASDNFETLRILHDLRMELKKILYRLLCVDWPAQHFTGVLGEQEYISANVWRVQM